MNDYIHISIIIDRSGSMESIRDDVIGGFNAFVGKQKNVSGDATLTMVQFDSHNPYEVIHDFRPLAEIPALDHSTYVPRGSTPLLDAIGCGINDLEARLAARPEAGRPGQVMVVIITDGRENASREFRHLQIQEMIARKSNVDHWQFVFLSADLDAIRDADTVGFKARSTLMFAKTGKGTKDAFDALAEKTQRYRNSKQEDFEFDEEDRKHDADPNRKKIH